MLGHPGEAWGAESATTGWCSSSSETLALRRRVNCANEPSMNRAPNRRNVLWLLAGLPLLAAGSDAFAAVVLIERLMREAQAFPHVSERIDFISGKLLGVRYRPNTLIGGPKQQEKFVVRDDAFDCVTFCEVVLAAALSRDLDGFETTLRRIRYDHGKVEYAQRNHYWAEWCQRNIENGVCQPIAIQPSVTFVKVVTWHREFAPRRVSIAAIDKTTLLSKPSQVTAGDIIGFASRRQGLDYYHTGFIAFAQNGELLLRSASLRHGRVLDEKMASFVATNSVKYVTLLRAAERAPVAERR
jgi:hypothetical protein